MQFFHTKNFSFLSLFLFCFALACSQEKPSGVQVNLPSPVLTPQNNQPPVQPLGNPQQIDPMGDEEEENEEETTDETDDDEGTPNVVFYGNMFVEEEGGGGHCGFYTLAAMHLDKEKPSFSQQLKIRERIGQYIRDHDDATELKPWVGVWQTESGSKPYYENINTTASDIDFLNQLAQRVENRDPAKPGFVYQMDHFSVIRAQKALNYRVLIINSLDLKNKRVSCEYPGDDVDSELTAPTHVGIGWGGVGHFQLLVHKNPKTSKLTRKFKVGEPWPEEVRFIVETCYKQRNSSPPAAWNSSLGK